MNKDLLQKENKEDLKISHTHPIILSVNKISKIFSDMGFDTVEGPEAEDEWHNFDALNVSKDHPSRDMQDTFWIKNIKTQNKLGENVGYVLRTHTSNMQIRTMEERMQNGRFQKERNIAICCPGKVFRNEATDARHEAQFYQVEGLYVSEDCNLSMMIGTLQKFFSDFFDREIKIRLRSSYFPFVEPGNEFDMECFKCKDKNQESFSAGNNNVEEKKCSVCGGSGWIEIGGAGMVHPKVLENCGIDSNEYKGFAFGCGVDRLAMLKYGIDDIRLLYNGDLRVVNQF